MDWLFCAIECVVPLSNGIIIGLVVSLIILLAVICLIVWKAVVTLHDKREYERFQTDIGNTQWKLVVSAVRFLILCPRLHLDG